MLEYVCNLVSFVVFSIPDDEDERSLKPVGLYLQNMLLCVLINILLLVSKYFIEVLTDRLRLNLMRLRYTIIYNAISAETNNMHLMVNFLNILVPIIFIIN